MSTITTKDGLSIFYRDWGSGQPIVSDSTHLAVLDGRATDLIELARWNVLR